MGNDVVSAVEDGGQGDCLGLCALHVIFPPHISRPFGKFFPEVLAPHAPESTPAAGTGDAWRRTPAASDVPTLRESPDIRLPVCSLLYGERNTISVSAGRTSPLPRLTVHALEVLCFRRSEFDDLEPTRRRLRRSSTFAGGVSRPGIICGSSAANDPRNRSTGRNRHGMCRRLRPSRSRRWKR